MLIGHCADNIGLRVGVPRLPPTKRHLGLLGRVCDARLGGFGGLSLGLCRRGREGVYRGGRPFESEQVVEPPNSIALDDPSHHNTLVSSGCELCRSRRRPCHLVTPLFASL
jgi:hypothetical protein